ncbi:MAG: class I SAM-dependent methyltransferase [Candidatus Micrarchaeota archaeon]|nr:class I SAM-dependent methyltransferase [Candidatus Micrarchaeota archaeon]
MENYSLARCRICNSKVTRFLDLGKTHPPEEFRRKSELGRPIRTFPLGLSYCPKCGQVQLSHEIPPDVMYKQHFFYDYSITKTGDKHYTELAELLKKKYKLTNRDLVVDVGSNTGKLLMIFRKIGVKILGVDPATRLVRVARKNGVPTIDSYFDSACAKRIVKAQGQARVITCNNVFDHVTDLHEFMRGVRILLKEDGVFVVEDPYFLTFFKTLGHVVYHQQLDYILVKAFAKLFDAHGMELIDCERIPWHGGSIRMYIAFKDVYKVNRHVQEFINEENRLVLKNEPKALKSWGGKILAQRDDMASLLKKLKRQGKSIGAIGASAKGNCLLYYSGIGPKTVDFITEKSNLKVGRYTPLGIPIVKDEVLFRKQPDYALLLAWNFSDELLAKLSPYTSKGGKIIVPIPKLKIVG